MLSNLFYLLHSVIIQDKSILLMTYNNNLTINDIKYRETCIPSDFNGVFAIEVNRGSYAFDADNFTLRTFDNYEVIPVENTLDNIKLSEGYTTLESYNYTYKRPHKLHIAYQIIVEPCISVCNIEYPNLTLYINTNKYPIPHQEHGYSIYKNISLSRGHYSIRIISESTQDWCSLPTKGDGFEAGRHLYIWTELVNDTGKLYIRSSLFFILLALFIKTDAEMDEMLDK